MKRAATDFNFPTVASAFPKFGRLPIRDDSEVHLKFLKESHDYEFEAAFTECINSPFRSKVGGRR